MNAIQLRDKLDKIISKGGGNLRVFTAYESETEIYGDNGAEMVPYFPEVEASEIEIRNDKLFLTP